MYECYKNRATVSDVAHPTTPQRAAIYVRISKDTEHMGLGVERQEEVCRRLAARLGWTVADDDQPLSDNDLSAWSGKRRPAYDRLLAGLADGTYDGVLCLATDRLYRRVGDLVKLIELLDKRDIPVEADLEGSVSLSTASGRREAINHANAAEFESSRKSERIKAQRVQAAEKGTYMGGQRPFGFLADGVTHHPTEAPALRKAVEDLLDGRSLNSVAKEMGVHRASLRRTLRSPRIAGLRQHQGEIVGEAAWDAIIDRTQWERLRIVMSDPARRTSRPARTYLLAGHVVAVDGKGKVMGRMVAHPAHGGVRRYELVGPKGRSVTAEPLERFVVAALLARFDTVTIEPPAVDDVADAAAAEVVAIEAEMAELGALRGAGEITLAEWMAARKPLQERLEAARSAVPIRRLPLRVAGVFATPGGLRAAWEAATTFAARRALIVGALELLGQVVAVGPASGPRNTFDADRVRFIDR